MNILQSGIPKSGNYWLYTINRHLIDKSNIVYSSYVKNQPIYSIAKNWDLILHNQAQIDVLDIKPNRIINRISRIYEMPVNDFDEYLSKSTLSWTHSTFNRECINIYSKFDKIVYIIRDPRAVVLSEAKFQNTEYAKKFLGSPGKDPQQYVAENLESRIKAWTKKILAFLEISKYQDIYPIFYENLKIDPSTEIEKLANYLEVKLTSLELAEIVDAVSLDTMKEKNPKHVRKGKLYEWKKKLNDEQKKNVDSITLPILNIFGYPDKEGDYSDKIGLKAEMEADEMEELESRINYSIGNPSRWKVLLKKILRLDL